MTLPYGATQQSCRQYTREYIAKNAEMFGIHPDDDQACWKLATPLSAVVWKAMTDVIVGAITAMDWLQASARVANRAGEPLRWHSPAGFPVYQPYRKYEKVRIRTSLFGDTSIRVTGRGDPGDVDGVRAANGVAPNYIHGMDSSHMIFTINEAMGEYKLSAMACIHDDYGTHACDTDVLYSVIRETFVKMYATTDWIQVWRREIERLNDDIELTEPPVPGELDVTEVLRSPFFFA